MNGPQAGVDVVGVGLINVDCVFRVPRLPAFGASQRAAGHVRACGGPAPNALACLSRLGASTRFVGQVGDDDEGAFLRAALSRQGVDVSRLRVRAGRSAVTLVLVEEATGERSFVAEPASFSGDAGLEAGDVAGARVVLVDDADADGLAAARLAGESGAIVVFDGTWQSPDLPQLLPLVDHAIVSGFFARRWLPDAGAETVLDRLLDMGAATAVVTLGERGCVARSGPGAPALSVAAVPVPVLDTTGAGDAFRGGFIFGLLKGWALEEVLTFAAATAALNCRALGGQAGLPRRPEVEELLSRTGSRK